MADTVFEHTPQQGAKTIRDAIDHLNNMVAVITKRDGIEVDLYVQKISHPENPHATMPAVLLSRLMIPG